MTEASESELIVRRTSDGVQLQQFEQDLLAFISTYKLPTTSVLVSVRERQAVFRNVEEVVSLIDEEQRQRSIYISKFIAAAASGLFDAALNYLWDETIYELRRRVAHYDLSYFFDVAVSSPDKRKRLKGEDDLPKIDDSELVKGANEIGLISELGLKQLDHIRYMRNWASAAHPNQNQITGLQLIAMLQTCINEVISLPLPTIVVEIKRLLSNIKSNSIAQAEARQIAVFFADLPQERVNSLASGFFGLYTQPGSTPQIRQNIHLLLPPLWQQLEESVRYEFGLRYARFLASNEQQQANLARQLLDLVEGGSYIPDSLRAAEIDTTIENLLTAHHGTNNFHTEPSFARELQRLVGVTGQIPQEVSQRYVLGVVEVFLTNGLGEAWNADPIYKDLIRQFDSKQALMAVLSFNDSTIASRLQFGLCRTKYKELLSLVENSISAPVARELIETVQSFQGPLEHLRDDSSIKRKVEVLNRIVQMK